MTTHFKAYGGIWPPHCVQGTGGAAFHPGLKPPARAEVVSKGMDPTQDSYSAFHAEDEYGGTLPAVLAARGIRRLYVGGLATDYCVRASALDALNGGSRSSFSRMRSAPWISSPGTEPGDAEMRQAGAKFATMDDLGI